MSEMLLQINFNFNVTKADYEQAATSLAGEFAEVDGLRWKIWTLNESENEAGGIYLFNDESSLQSFLAGPLAEKVKNHPALVNMIVKQFYVMSDVTAITRGPV